MKNITRTLWALSIVGLTSLTANAQINTIKHRKEKPVVQTAPTHKPDFQTGSSNYAKNVADEPGLTTPAPSITVHIQPDNFPDEITWEFYDGEFNIVASGGPYNSDPEIAGIINEVIPVNAGVCYTFVIYDAYGDGICCGDGGDGFYQLLSYQNEPFATGGQYNDNQVVSFCVTEEVAAVATHTLNNIKLYPNPATGVINLEIPNSILLPDGYTIYNSLGQVVNSGAITGYNQQINVANFAGGVYFIKISGGSATKTIQFIKS